MESQRLTASAMARPKSEVNKINKFFKYLYKESDDKTKIITYRRGIQRAVTVTYFCIMQLTIPYNGKMCVFTEEYLL
jgi:hypothetical protein